MTVAEAVKELGYSEWTIRQAARDGKIIGTRDGRDYDLNAESVREFKRKRRLNGANAPMRELMKRGVLS